MGIGVRLWRAGAVATLLVGTALGGVGASPVGAVTTSNKVFIQLGDSFASGEGAGWRGNSSSSQSAQQGNREGTDMAAAFDGTKWTYHPETTVYQAETYRELDHWWGDNPCHRSLQPPILHARDTSSARVLNLACSGARSKHIWPYRAGGVDQHSGVAPQLEQLKAAISSADDVAMVAIGVGGNDIKIPAYDKEGFGKLVVECMTAYAHTYFQDGYGARSCRETIEAGAGNAISDIFYNQLKTIDLVRSTLAAEGHPVGSYKLVLTGYPTITPTEWGDWSDISEAGQWSSKCPIRRADSGHINLHVVSRLNDVIQAAAEQRGVGFINMEEVFDGHRLCEEGTNRGSYGSSHPESAEWVRFLDINVRTVNPIWEGLKGKLFGSSPDEQRSKDLDSERSIAESFHPNAFGQKALGNCLKSYFNDAPDNSSQRCFVGGEGPFDTPDYMTTSPLAAQPQFIDDPVGSSQIGTPLTRSVIVPDSVKAGHYIQWLPQISHPRKGQLRVELTAPNGEVHRLSDYDFSDTGAWANGTHTRNFTADPSGLWTLRVWDGYLTTHNGSLDKWSLKFF